ncbi:uncharacterized protein B0H64DRAFT_388234 [Chaetomium fimeti]|uniref:HTH psq-type domain-containing protein n=1 Tax=Chaetomium fimeti TaxID=1854472 RepID=A0AAE0LVY7_9PEZI|nr:hypothetical protein B0H64DRAFT_388234 [Chaetomium fimeti]
MAEQRIQAAIAAFHAKEVPSIRQAATTFGIPLVTLADRIAGRYESNWMADIYSFAL